MRRYNLARIDSLARSSHEESGESVAPVTSGMSLDCYYLLLGKAAKSDFQNGLITQTAYIFRLNELRNRFATLKGAAY